MPETYPSDNELLNLLEDTETGVEYIPTGTSPYYLHFRKLLYRLLLSCKRSNDLRVFDEGGLNIGVKSGKYWVGFELINYGGSSGNTLADNKSKIYVYLDSDGVLVTDNYTDWPNMGTMNHVRLAEVTTSGGEITAIVDARDHHSIAVPSAGGGGSSAINGVIEEHTADDTLAESESGSVHTNRGATGVVTLTLPAGASAGTTFTFAVQTVQQLRIDPGTAAIRDDSGQSANKYKWADGIGESLVLMADPSGDWITISKRGVWLEEA